MHTKVAMHITEIKWGKVSSMVFVCVCTSEDIHLDLDSSSAGHQNYPMVKLTEIKLINEIVYKLLFKWPSNDSNIHATDKPSSLFLLFPA